MWGGAGQWSRCTLLDWLTFPAPSLTPEGTALTEEGPGKTYCTHNHCAVLVDTLKLCINYIILVLSAFAKFKTLPQAQNVVLLECSSGAAS